MTYKQAEQKGEQLLETAGIMDAKIDAWLLLEMVAKIDRSFYFTHTNEEVDPEVLAECLRVQLIGKVFRDICIDLHRKLLLSEGHHSVQAKEGCDCLKNVRCRCNVVNGDEGLRIAGLFQFGQIDPIIFAKGSDLTPAFLMGVIAKYLPKQQISDHDISKMNRNNAFRESRMAAVGVG